MRGSISCEVRPVAPVLAIFILAILFVIGLYEAVRVPPYGLEHPRPRIPDTDVARLATPGLKLIPFLIVDYWIDAEHTRATASRLHRLQGRHRATKKAARFRLPPGVHDDRFSLTHNLVVPSPYLRLYRLSHGGHVFEMIIVLLELLRARFPEHAYRRGRRVEYVHAQPLRYPPGPPGIRVGGHAFVRDTGGAKSQRAINNVGVARDPPYIGEAPINILRVNVLIILRRACNIGQISPGAMLTPLRLCRCTAGIHHEQRSFGRHRYGIHSVATILLK